MTLEHTNILSEISELRKHPHILDKQHIEDTYENLGKQVMHSVFFNHTSQPIQLGDDTAAILQEDGSYLLFAAEGIVTDFLENDPWFAGYSAIMVNISDICSMGGLPVAVTDTLYAKNASDTKLIWEGMLAAATNYGIPIVGGHTCYHNDNKALSVSILGKSTNHLLSSFDAEEGDEVLIITDLNGAYYKEYPFWNASTTSSAKRLQQLAKLPYTIANNQWSNCAKDISMGGIIGTLLMLMNTSKVGINLNLDLLTKPLETSWNKWLVSFPSYGYIMTCKAENTQKIQQLFIDHEIECNRVGNVIAERELCIQHENSTLKF